MFDLDANRLILGPVEFKARISCLEFSPNGPYLAAASQDHNLNSHSARLFDLRTKTEMDRNLPHADGIHSVQFSPDSKLIVTAGEDFVARIWNRETGQQITPPLRHRHQVWAATFNPDGRWIATISVDKTARLWDARTGDPLAPPCLLPEMGTSIVFLDNLPRLLLGGTRGNSWIWDLSPDNPSPQELDRLARTLTGTAVTSESPAYR